MKLTRPLAGLAALALIAAACGGGGDESADSTTPATTAASTTSTTVEASTTTRPRPTTSTTVPATIRQPLTGEPLDSVDEILLRPALVAKIDNNAQAVPNHSGLAVADIVYEEIVEGRTTRFAAVFHSQSSDPLGPIRSGRIQDINLLTSYNEPLLVWSGGNAVVTRAINDSFLVNMGPNNASGYFRGPGRAPHNLYNTTDRIWLQTPEGFAGPPPPHFPYLEADEDFEGAPIGGVEVRVGNERIEWTWNPEFEKFDRSQRGREHNDNTFGRIRATNVIVMGVEYLNPRSPEAQTIGRGPAYVFTDGEFVEGTWSREFAFFPIEYFDADGEPIAINPGNTWIELADNDDVVDGAVVAVPATPPTP